MMGMDKITIPDPRTTTRTRSTTVKRGSDWVSPYTPAQALAIALFNNHVVGTLDDACRMAEASLHSLGPMGFTLAFTGV